MILGGCLIGVLTTIRPNAKSSARWTIIELPPAASAQTMLRLNERVAPTSGGNSSPGGAAGGGAGLVAAALGAAAGLVGFVVVVAAGGADFALGAAGVRPPALGFSLTVHLKEIGRCFAAT